LKQFRARDRKLFRIRRTGGTIGTFESHTSCASTTILDTLEELQRMEDKGKGFSLRQKKSSRRPPISAPKQFSSHGTALPPSRQNGVNGPPVRAVPEKPKPGSNTSDLVKRRYSTRFIQLPDFSNADAPPIPQPPETHLIQQRTHLAPATNQKIKVDILSLRDPDLQAEHCKFPYLPYNHLHTRTGDNGVLLSSIVVSRWEEYDSTPVSD